MPWPHVFAHNGHELGVQLLIDKGFDLRARGLFQETVFELVARRSDVALMGGLLDTAKGGDADAILGDSMYIAVELGHTPLLQFLMERGADIVAAEEPLLNIPYRKKVIHENHDSRSLNTQALFRLTPRLHGYIIGQT